MTVIKVTCPDCGKIISVQIATIDKLRSQVAQVTKDRDIYKQKLDAIENMRKTNPLAEMFGGTK